MKKWWKKYKVPVAIAVSGAVIACIYGYKEYTRKLPDTNQLKAAFTLKATDLIQQFAADEAKATVKYSDHVISVQGIVDSVQPADASGAVFLNDGSSVTSVMCQFDKKNCQEILGLQKGEVITIKGICSGYLMDVVMVRCVVE